MGMNSIFSFFTGSRKRWFFSIWMLIALFVWLFQGDPVTLLSAMGVIFSGLSTVLFWIFRKPIKLIVKGIKLSSGKKFVLIGSVCAVWIELIFWILETVSGVTGIAASPNLALDLIATMPWYIGMVAILWVVEKKYSYPFYGILMLGGIYDFFADGIFGQLINFGGLSPINFLLLIFIFPIFVITYSLIVLAPTYLLKDEIKRRKSKGNKYFYGLLPLVWMLIFGIIVFFLFSG